MPTLFARSRPNLRGRLILRRLLDAAQEPTQPHVDHWRVDDAHHRADCTKKTAIQAGQDADLPKNVG